MIIYVRMCPEPIPRSAPEVPVAEAADVVPAVADEAVEADPIRVAAGDFNEEVTTFFGGI